MLERLACGELPAKHHLALYSASGQLRYESCLTRQGFEGAYTIAYHDTPPPSAGSARGSRVAATGRRPGGAEPDPTPGAVTPALPHRLSRPSPARAALSPCSITPIEVVGCRQPTHDDAAYHLNADADELWFVLSGRGTLRSALGDLEFQEGDYVCVPKGVVPPDHRWLAAPTLSLARALRASASRRVPQSGGSAADGCAVLSSRFAGATASKALGMRGCARSG